MLVSTDLLVQRQFLIVNKRSAERANWSGPCETKLSCLQASQYSSPRLLAWLITTTRIRATQQLIRSPSCHFKTRAVTKTSNTFLSVSAIALSADFCSLH